jgi:hypothetical protein
VTHTTPSTHKTWSRKRENVFESLDSCRAALQEDADLLGRPATIDWQRDARDLGRRVPVCDSVVCRVSCVCVRARINGASERGRGKTYEERKTASCPIWEGVAKVSEGCFSASSDREASSYDTPSDAARASICLRSLTTHTRHRTRTRKFE